MHVPSAILAIYFFITSPQKGSCQNCFDTHQLCQFWANIGECNANPVWMRPNCPFSCNQCGRGPPLYDDYGNPINRQQPQPDYNNPSFDYRFDNVPPQQFNNFRQQPPPQQPPPQPQFQQQPPPQPQFPQPQQPLPQQAPPPQAPVQTQVATPANAFQRCQELSQDSENAAQVMRDEGLMSEFEGNKNFLTLNDIESSNRGRNCVPTLRASDCSSNPCFHLMFRTMDGTCNNQANPFFGAAFTQQMRLMGAAFDDGVNAPVSSSNNRRPSPRDIVSNSLQSPRLVEHQQTNMLIMQWGQFLAHDLVKTTLLPEEPCTSCGNNNQCVSIPVNPFDQSSGVFGCEGRGAGRRCCIRISRSSPICGTGQGVVRQVLNENTAFIDGSQIYGSSVPDMQRLRSGPFLRANVANGGAWPPRNNRNEFIAGDDRINVFVGLAAMHTLFLREHNRLVGLLRQLNPSWNEDRLFQEARKIVGAELQAISYKEWLPEILGVPLNDYTGFNPSTDPGVSVEFATGIFRFGHGMIREFIPRLNSNGQQIPNGGIGFEASLNSPDRLVNEGGVDALIRGMARTPTKMPQRITTSVTNRLFGNKDLASINILRGRDNGVVSYNELRGFCGLTRATSFDELAEITDDAARASLQQQYSSPDEIDAFAGAILEEPVSGIVGPTMACIIRNQFNRLREGDRLWYQRAGVFTPDQLAQIEQTSLARVLCDNGESMGSMPQHGMRLEAPVACSNIPGIDLSAWRS